jgi:hypothetical protein
MTPYVDPLRGRDSRYQNDKLVRTTPLTWGNDIWVCSLKMVARVFTGHPLQGELFSLSGSWPDFHKVHPPSGRVNNFFDLFSSLWEPPFRFVVIRRPHTPSTHDRRKVSRSAVTFLSQG